VKLGGERTKSIRRPRENEFLVHFELKVKKRFCCITTWYFLTFWQNQPHGLHNVPPSSKQKLPLWRTVPAISPYIPDSTDY